MDQLKARQAFWRQGVIAPWYLRPSQLDVYELLTGVRNPFIEAARRFGKTTSILAFVLEQLIQHEGWICRWCFPNKNQAREVLSAEIAKLNKFASPGMTFEYATTDSVFEGPGGSKLYIRGVNEDKGDSARGPASNIIVADEYGFWVEPDYIVRECLSPQLQNQQGRHFIKASTPPRDLGHLYYAEREEAVRKERFIQKTILDNEALSAEELQEIIEECGGIDSPSFRRERMCEPVSDPESLIVPEWSDSENILPDDHPRPEHFHTYVSGDSGFDDNTAIEYGYYDFEHDIDIIEDELVVKGMATSEITRLSKLKEMQLWGANREIDFAGLASKAKEAETAKIIDDLFDLFRNSPRAPRRRSYDADKQALFDLFTDHKYPVELPPKNDKYAAINNLRKRVGQRKFKVKARCKQTCRQLKVGMWKDDRHSDFERSEGLGHLDAIAASIYFGRIINRKLSPFPANYGASKFTHFISTAPATSRGQTEQALSSLFGKTQRKS